MLAQLQLSEEGVIMYSTICSGSQGVVPLAIGQNRVWVEPPCMHRTACKVR
jgi:hypothetical protein